MLRIFLMTLLLILGGEKGSSMADQRFPQRDNYVKVSPIPEPPVPKGGLLGFGIIPEDIISRALKGNLGGLLGWPGARALHKEATGLFDTLAGGTGDDTRKGGDTNFYINKVYPRIREAEGKFTNREGDPGNYQGFEGNSFNWRGNRRGKLVGTNRGVTAFSLAKHRGISPYTITEEMIRNIDEDTAREIFKNQYYDRYKVGKIKDPNLRIMAGIMAPLRPSTIDIIRKSKDTSSAVLPVLKDFKKVGLKRYNDHILGWANRVMNAANLPTFKDRSALFSKYPDLKRGK